jgi:hypothetical protein
MNATAPRLVQLQWLPVISRPANDSHRPALAPGGAQLVCLHQPLSHLLSPFGAYSRYARPKQSGHRLQAAQLPRAADLHVAPIIAAGGQPHCRQGADDAAFVTTEPFQQKSAGIGQFSSLLLRHQTGLDLPAQLLNGGSYHLRHAKARIAARVVTLKHQLTHVLEHLGGLELDLSIEQDRSTTVVLRTRDTRVPEQLVARHPQQPVVHRQARRDLACEVPCASRFQGVRIIETYEQHLFLTNPFRSPILLWAIAQKPCPRRMRGVAQTSKEVPMSKIFVRERRHVGPGAGRPRFAIVGSQGADLHIYKTRVRKAELETIAMESGAEIVYLPRGEQSEEEEQRGARRGRRRDREAD